MKNRHRFSILTAIFLPCVGFANTPAPHNNIEIAAFSYPAAPEEWREQKTCFQRYGFIWIKDFFTEEQASSFNAWAQEMNRAAQEMLQHTQHAGIALQDTFKNDPKTLIIVPEARDPLQVCRVEDMLTCYPDLHLMIENTLTSFINTLLSEPYILFKDKLNFKWPGGGAFLPHQDFPAYALLAPRQHVTAMVSIDAASAENGNLKIAKDWTKAFIACENIDAEALQTGHAILPYIKGGSSHGAIEPEYAKRISWIELNTSPRDLVLFNSFIPHYSETNQSEKPRRAMFFTYNKLKEGEQRTAYYDAKRNDPDNPIFHIGTPTKARDK